jgi:hypothetical protein
MDQPPLEGWEMDQPPLEGWEMDQPPLESPERFNLRWRRGEGKHPSILHCSIEGERPLLEGGGMNNL